MPFDTSGNMWAFDGTTARKNIIIPAGIELGTPITLPASTNIAFDPYGGLWACDGTDTVKKYSYDGDELASYQLDGVVNSMAFDSSGYLWTTDGVDTVTKYKNGVAVGSPTTLSYAVTISFDSSGYLWVTNGTTEAKRYGQSATGLVVVGSPISLNADTVDYGAAIDFDSSGRLWGNAGNNSFTLFNRAGEAISSTPIVTLPERITTNPLAQTFADNLAAAGYTLSGARLKAYSDFITVGESEGWWAKLVDCGTFEGTSVAHAAVKLKAKTGSPSSLTAVGSIVNGDIKTNGGTYATASTKYWEPGFNFNTLAQYDNGFAVWLSERAIADLSIHLGVGAWASAYPYNYIITQGATFGMLIYSQGAAIAPSVGHGTFCPIGGFIQTSRSATNEAKLAFNGRVCKTVTNYVAGTPSGNMRVGTGLHFYAVTTSFSSNEMLLFKAAVLQLLTTLGRLPKSPAPLRKIMMTGQSQAAGSTSTPALSTTASSYKETALSQYDYFDSGARYANSTTSSRFFDIPGVANSSLYATETPITECQRTVAKLWRAANPGTPEYWDTVASNFASGATALSVIKKNGTGLNYLNSMTAVADCKNFANINHTGFELSALVMLHGSTDDGNVNYATELENYRLDYDTDAKSLGQSTDVHLVTTQWSFWSKTQTVGNSPYRILTAHRTNPTKNHLACPSYFVTHNTDGIHLTNTSSRKIGAYLGKCLFNAVALGNTWSPLVPATILRNGTTIVVTFNGRVGDLVLDELGGVTSPNGAAMGFEWVATGRSETISSVTLTDSNTTVTITLSADPGVTTGEYLRYAYTGIQGQNGGPTTGARGCLRDSDTTTGYSGDVLPNWCVHFNDTVTRVS